MINYQINGCPKTQAFSHKAEAISPAIIPGNKVGINKDITLLCKLYLSLQSGVNRNFH